MEIQDFLYYWDDNYPLSPPIAHYLKFLYTDRWLRIHTLPEAKRYADTESEHQEILHRHNTALSAFIHPGGQYALMTCGYSRIPQPTRPPSELPKYAEGNRHLRTIALHELEEDADPNYRHLFINMRIWSPHSIDDLLRQVAEEEIANVIIVGFERSILYLPYDGGADIILKTKALRDEMKEKFSSWLSTHPLGL